jgi:hypothetical protein
MDTSKYQKRFSEARKMWNVFQLKPFMVLATFKTESDADKFLKSKYDWLQAKTEREYDRFFEINNL